MVDWDAVEKLRSKGWDWDRIAADPKVGFHAEEAAGEPGRALRALYYQRRSKGQRRPSKSENGSGKATETDQKEPWSLARIGYILVPVAAIWFVAAYLYPSPVGTYFPAIPWIGLILAVTGFVLAFGLLRTDERWSKVMRTSVIGGIVIGLILVGGLTLVAEINGCPTLPPISGSEPQGWEKANTAAWTSGGTPVFFFLGSEACPYCSASSWAMWKALAAFGPVTGITLFHSNPNDNPPSVPEVVLASASVQSQYVSFSVLEGTDDSTITIPPASSCVQQAYTSAYDTGGSIPFVVINGQYVHVGTLVDPTALTSYSPQQVQGQVLNASGPAWDAISPATYMMEAYLVKANGGQPANIADNTNVAPLLAQIT
ncbi:MAG TPA: DUF929 family protein [Thermoplasmata archaeon]|nr:DUF929 family protein [Thermoplasmata archaeon]